MLSLITQGKMITVNSIKDGGLPIVEDNGTGPDSYAISIGYFNANEDGPQKGYGFKTVDYFLGSDSIMSRRVRQVQGLRFIFDVTGRARQYSQVVLMTTIVSGFGFAALAFVIVNEIRLSLEKTRVTGRQN